MKTKQNAHSSGGLRVRHGCTYYLTGGGTKQIEHGGR